MRLDTRPPYRWTSFILLILTIALAVSSGVLQIGTAQQQTQNTTKITLLQVNDVYQFAPVDRGARGGSARLMTLKKQIQAESPHTLFLLAGDTISPSVESAVKSGAVSLIVRLMCCLLPGRTPLLRPREATSRTSSPSVTLFYETPERPCGFHCSTRSTVRR